MLRLERTFIDMSKRLMAGDIPAILGRFETPVAIYSGRKVVVCRDLPSLAQVLSRYRDRLARHGAQDLQTRAVAVPLMRGKTGTIWVENSLMDGSGGVMDRWQMRFFFRLAHGLPRICMVEYLRCQDVAAEARSVPAERPALRMVRGG